ncbi:MAG TPA: NAD(P)-dependent oxidoreductase [Ignavibacteria bacterium]|nr:NAD(P)-dependent oxidoreductase [Ignavibacteria bacterium]
MIKILIADKINLTHLPLFPKNKFHITAFDNIPNSEIIKKYNDYDVLVIRSIRKIGKKFLSKAKFKIIATVSRGTDHIDVAEAKKQKIKVLNIERGNSLAAAEHTLALLLAVSKNIIFSNKCVRENRFTAYDYERFELEGKTIGIIGFGSIGSLVGKYCKALGMKILVNDTDKKVIVKNKNFKFVSLDYLLEASDIITVHIPLENNKNFLSKDKLRKLKPSAILINTSRGEVLDESFLIKLLKAKKIKSAALDVFKNEPLINKQFYGLPNVLLTNHIAGKTTESSSKMTKEIFIRIKNLYQNI